MSGSPSKPVRAGRTKEKVMGYIGEEEEQEEETWEPIEVPVIEPEKAPAEPVKVPEQVPA
jgi:hypothetical protein